MMFTVIALEQKKVRERNSFVFVGMCFWEDIKNGIFKMIYA